MRDFYVGVLGATPVDGDVRIGDSLISFAPRDTQETTKEVFVSMNHPSGARFAHRRAPRPGGARAVPPPRRRRRVGAQ